MVGAKCGGGRIIIGKNNIFREYVTINSSSSPEKETAIGDNNFLMAFSHVAHEDGAQPDKRYRFQARAGDH